MAKTIGGKMNRLEKTMVESLIDLKTNHHVIGIKAEFEAEGTRLEEALRLKEVVTRAGLDLTIKVGGCEAVKDMYETFLAGAHPSDLRRLKDFISKNPQYANYLDLNARANLIQQYSTFDVFDRRLMLYDDSVSNLITCLS